MRYTCLLDLENECKHKLFVHNETCQLPFNLGCFLVFLMKSKLIINKICLMKIINKL